MRLFCTRHQPVGQVGRHARRRRTHGGGSHDGQFFRFLGVGFTQVDDLEIMMCGARKDLHDDGWLGLESINEFCLRLQRNGGTRDACTLKVYGACIESDRSCW
jgi:hypothetical protein